MEIGLLICDHARKELNHPDGSYPEMFRRLLPDFDFSDYYVCDGNFPGSPYECDGWCIGVHEFEMTVHEPWIWPWLEKVNLLMICQDQVVELPPDTTILARSPMCPNAMILIGKNMLGIQGHPEFWVDFEHQLILANAPYLETEQIASGILSLQKAVHSLEVGEWMGRFLRG